MRDPIKIIWKYKNNNKNIQYNIYIYIGKTPLNKILLKIQNLDLLETMTKLTKDELNELKNFYGDKWHYKFFTIEHVKNIILNNEHEFKNILGKEWVDNNNYILYENINWYDKKFFDYQIGGDIDYDLFDNLNQNIFDNIEEKNIKNIDKLEMMVFDTGENDIKNIEVLDSEFKNEFNKIYITNCYIYKDDSIKKIKEKICSTLKNNKKFDDESYILPSRQYLWIEQQKKKISLNHTITNLDINIEPNNNISVYENLIKLKDLEKNMYIENKEFNIENNDLKLLNTFKIENNEIFMIDIYNQLGLSYNNTSAQLNNLEKIYLKLYFPNITKIELGEIILYLNGDKEIEKKRIISEHESIQNRISIETKITNTVDNFKINENYKYTLGKKHITQSIIYLKIEFNKKMKNKLYHIFNDFELSLKYPYLQFKRDEYNNYKLFSGFKNNELIEQWSKNKLYGLLFKILIDDEKYLSVSLDENGRMEYKLQWKEDYYATINDINKTFEFIKELLVKINKESKKINIKIPTNDQFNFAFINIIQKINFPLNYEINHNDLSNFARYFFPYISLIISPKKRESKITSHNKHIGSKYGTYLRYKRIDNYDDCMKIDNKILYFLKNYDFTIDKLISEISKQFNITESITAEKIKKVQAANPHLKTNIKKKNKENLPKIKPPGINIDIQGKTSDKYKIRISGIKNLQLMDDILDFMALFLHLYIETYIYNKKDKLFLKDELDNLKDIAKRLDTVEKNNIVKNKNLINIKKMTNIDKKRLGFKPQEGQVQWTKSCQNSGNDKRRQPIQFSSIKDLEENGFKYNKDTKLYQNDDKQIAVELKNDDMSVFYTCNNDKNGDHRYVGFLTKSIHPDGFCMPCCFKKNQYNSDNSKKRLFFEKCIHDNLYLDIENIGDQLYILKDTNKVQKNRLCILSEYLDIYLNKMNKNKFTIKNHYLIDTDCYYFKYGVSNNSSISFIDAINNIFKIDNIYDKLTENLFISLNNGEIKNKFQTISNYINHIKNNPTFENINNFLSLPGILLKNGLNIIIFEKKNINLNIHRRDNNKLVSDFEIKCQDIEDCYSIKDNKRSSIILLDEHNKYYIIVEVKKDKNSKDIILKKIFHKNKIIDYISDFYLNNCSNLIIKDNLTAKYVYNILSSEISYQIIDVLNKCIYLITKNNYIIPVHPSGSIPYLEITEMKKEFIQTFKNTVKFISNLPFKIKIIGVFYDKIIDNDSINIVSLNVYENKIINIIPEIIKIKNIEEMNYEYNLINIDLNENLLTNEKINHSYIVKENLYEEEGYNLFKLEVSNYLNENNDLKNIIINIINNKDYVIDKLRIIFYKIIDNELYQRYKKIKNIDYDIDVSSFKNFVIIDNEQTVKKNLLDYKLLNNRVLCKNVNDCEKNYHCSLKNNKCYFTISKKLIIIYVNKISEELSLDNLNSHEILNKEGCYVSETINYNYFEKKDNQYIVNNTKLNLINEDVFPKLSETSSFYSQQILNDDLKIFRAYSNGYYWIRNKYQYPDIRNLGYYSDIQTELSNFFKGNIFYKFNCENDIDILKKLTLVYNIPIIVYNENHKIIHIFEKGENVNKKVKDYSLYINIKFIFDNIEIIYYD